MVYEGQRSSWNWRRILESPMLPATVEPNLKMLTHDELVDAGYGYPPDPSAKDRNSQYGCCKIVRIFVSEE
jgi:hypothetical protein